MDEVKKRNILVDLETIFEKTRTSRGGPLIINHDELYMKVVEALYKEKFWSDKFSRKFISNKIDEIIIRLVLEDKSSRDLPGYLDGIISELDLYSIEQVVYIPLFGIDMMSCPQIELGNVIIKRIDEDKVVELIAKVHHATKLCFDIFEKIYNSVCTEFHIVAEPILALEIAEIETMRAIDLLRYSIPFAYPTVSDSVRVALQGEVSRTRRFEIISSSSESFNTLDSIIGPLYNFEISPENIKIMKKIGVFTLSKLLSSQDKLSSLEEKILSSVHWFANSQMKTEREDQLLNLVTCLETFFTPEDVRDPIIQNVAEGTALLIQDNEIDRKNTITIIRRLYSLRSSLSHHGQGKVRSEDISILKRIDMLVLTTLIELIEKSNEFNGKGELQKMIEFKRLGGSIENWGVYKKKTRK
jgi:hypothetical protein